MSNFIIRLVIRIRLNATLSVMQVVSGHDGGECIRRHSYTARDGYGNGAAVLDHSLAVVEISHGLTASIYDACPGGLGPRSELARRSIQSPRMDR